ncbi:MAG: DHH family phosphoesterase [Pseudomonadales bacterium]
MPDYDVFNGDADGICALIQLRKAEPRDATLVTGVKRDINLLAKVEATEGDQVTVLDVSMDKNKDDLQRVLNRGASVFYVDHHFAGDIPNHERLHSIINEGAEVCTAVLVNGHLKGAFPDWAVVGAFGDNFKKTAHRLAAPLNLSEVDLKSLENLGIYVNYNGYGSSIEDLHFNPEDLYNTLFEADSALEFIASSPDYQKLSIGYAQDMAKAAELKPIHSEQTTAVFKLPNAAWALRVRGVYGNDLAMENPDRAHAVVTEKDNGNYLVSVRAPLNNRQGAAELCMQFPTGGGRTAAAGINDLPRTELDAFINAFTETY